MSGSSPPAAALPGAEAPGVRSGGITRRSAFFALADQGFNSLSSLLPAIALIVLSDPATYGQFAFVFTIVLIANSLQYGAIGVPILVHLQQVAPEERGDRLALLLRLDTWVRLAAGVATAGLAYAFADGPLTLIAAGLFAFVHLSRETARNRLYAEGRSDRAALLASIAFLLLALLLAVLVPAGLTAASALIASALASSVALVLCGGLGLAALRPPADLVRRYLAEFGGAAWSLANSAANEAQTRFHVLFLSGFRGMESVGTVEAGRLVWMPCMLLMAAWQRVAQPRVAEHVRLGRHDAARRLALLGAAGMLAAGVVYAVPVWLAWPLLRDHVFHAYGDMVPFVLGWAAYTALLLTNWNLILYLNAVRRFRPVATVAGFATLATCGLLLVVALDVPLYSVLIVMGLVQAGVLASLLALMFRPLPRPAP